MTNHKTTQRNLAFYVLYTTFKKNMEEYVPIWAFVGEIEMPEFGKWALMSYKCPARLSEIYNDNPGLLDREKVRGKSGAMYYRYRLSPFAKKEMILDPTLFEFYKEIKTREREGRV